jgi:hypothetical protein
VEDRDRKATSDVDKLEEQPPDDEHKKKRLEPSVTDNSTGQ